MLKYPEHGIRDAAEKAGHAKHLFQMKKEVGMVNRSFEKRESHYREYDALAARFSTHLKDSNSGFMIIGGGLFRSNAAEGQGGRYEFIVRMRKISSAMNSNGDGHRLLFLAKEAPAAVSASMFRYLHGAKPNILVIGKNDRLDVPSCAEGVRGKKPEFRSLARFLNNFDRILVGGIFKDVKNAIADLERLFLELGINGKPIGPAYNFTIDDDGRIIRGGK